MPRVIRLLNNKEHFQALLAQEFWEVLGVLMSMDSHAATVDLCATHSEAEESLSQFRETSQKRVSKLTKQTTWSFPVTVSKQHVDI